MLDIFTTHGTRINLCQIHHYCRFSLDVTNIQTKELSIDLSFYFREVLPQQNGFS